MIKTILNTLLDSFCCLMLVSFFSLGFGIFAAPFFTPDSLWSMLFCVPFVAVGFAFFAVLDRRG